jgi:transcriptional regulator with XRE-family HTH domain
MDEVGHLLGQSEGGSLSGAGDLGRRVAERRTSLGLSREDLALRAAMSPTFVHYLETSPSPELSHEALRRLGTALACEVDVLTGGHMEEPREEPSRLVGR